MLKEYKLLKVGNITYTNKSIIFKNDFVKIIIPYDEIDTFYVRKKLAYSFHSTLGIAKVITIITKAKKTYDLEISINSSLAFFDSFESKHVAFIKKMAPQARYIKRESLKKKIKRKLKQIDIFLKSDD